MRPISMFDTLPIPKAETPQELRAAFPHKTSNSLKVIHPQKGELVNVSFHLSMTPNYRRFLVVRNLPKLAPERSKCPNCLKLRFHINRAKNDN